MEREMLFLIDYVLETREEILEKVCFKESEDNKENTKILFVVS